MKNIYILMVSIISILGVYSNANAQGCVAIHATGGFDNAGKGVQSDTASKWQVGINNRYFKSFRHYIGTVYQAQRAALGNEVINHQYTMDVQLTHFLDSKWSIMVDLPIEANARSQTYTQDGLLNRFSTHSFGEGDIRFAVYRWIVDPVKSPRANLQVGLGIKLPTGDDNYEDYFKTSDSTKTYGPVDQSIELGDGGTGLTLELNGYYNLSPRMALYGNFYYLSNPRDQNGVSNAHGATPSASSVLNGSNIMSVPDQYMARLGADYMAGRWIFSGGVRDECLPVHDLIGGSDGFRRPGFIISGEPGVTYNVHKMSLYAFVPIAIVRDRTQSVPDKITTALTGVYTHGDAAFADYVINIGATFKF